MFQPRQVEQVVDHDQEPLGIVAGIDEQFELLGRQRPEGFLQEQVEHKPDARQRRLQLVADGGHEIALHFVEQAKAGNVLQEHRGPERRAVRIADRQDARQERVGFLSHVQHDGLVESLGQVLAAVLQNIGQRLPQRFGRLPDKRRLLLRLHRHDPEDAARHGIGQFDVLLESTTSTGSGKELIVAWLVFCARVNCALCDWR